MKWKSRQHLKQRSSALENLCSSKQRPFLGSGEHTVEECRHKYQTGEVKIEPAYKTESVPERKREREKHSSVWEISRTYWKRFALRRKILAPRSVCSQIKDDELAVVCVCVCWWENSLLFLNTHTRMSHTHTAQLCWRGNQRFSPFSVLKWQKYALSCIILPNAQRKLCGGGALWIK